MTAETLRSLMHAQPFEPFELRMPSGATIPVRHPDFIAISPRGRHATVYLDRERFEMIDVMLVEALVSSREDGGDRGEARAN